MAGGAVGQVDDGADEADIGFAQALDAVKDRGLLSVSVESQLYKSFRDDALHARL